jgi:hypothetical protein
MILPARPSDVRPKLPVFLMSVGAVAGIKGERFKTLKTLKKLARIASLDPPPKKATLGSRLRLTRESTLPTPWVRQIDSASIVILDPHGCILGSKKLPSGTSEE